LFEAMLDEFGDDADILTIRKDGKPLASVSISISTTLSILIGAAAESTLAPGAPTSSCISS
jgi:hypothetical protein